MGAGKKDAPDLTKTIDTSRRLAEQLERVRLASDAVVADAKATLNWCKETLRRTYELSRSKDAAAPGRNDTSEE